MLFKDTNIFIYAKLACEATWHKNTQATWF